MRWVIALKAEAKEIIKQYDLISFDHEGPFPVYKNKNQLEMHFAANYHDFIVLLQSLAKLSGTILSWRDISIEHGEDNKLNMFINLSVYNL